MKTLFRIIRTELQLLFYSPVVWVMFVAFIIQATYAFLDIFKCCFLYEHSFPWPNLTAGIFVEYPDNPLVGYDALPFFPHILRYLYLYIPLLTMNLMTRELESGSIRLLYASPITKFQLILGKYLTVVICNVLLIGIMFLFCLFSDFAIDGFDYSFVLVGLLGIFLLLGMYAAIGLFISSLTSSLTVSAVVTYAVFFGLNEVGNLNMRGSFGHFLSWFSVEKQMAGFPNGAISLESLSYFLILIFLFLGGVILYLQYLLQKTPLPVIVSKYALLIGGAGVLGYATSRSPERLYGVDASQPATFKVGFLQGHGERKYKGKVDSSYEAFCKSLFGGVIFECRKITLKNRIPSRVKLLVIADLQKPLTKEEQMYLDSYIAYGGDVWIFGEPERQQVLNQALASLGVEFMKGRLVKPDVNKAIDDISCMQTAESRKINADSEEALLLSMPGCARLKYVMNKGFEVTSLMGSPLDGWNELEATDFSDTSAVRLNAMAGEVKQSYPTVLLLSRKVEGKQQQIVIFGDADCVSNKRYYRTNENKALNSHFIRQLFNYSYGEMIRQCHIKSSHQDGKVFLVDKEDDLCIDLRDLERWRIILGLLLPGMAALVAFIIWKRRNNR